MSSIYKSRIAKDGSLPIAPRQFYYERKFNKHLNKLLEKKMYSAFRQFVNDVYLVVLLWVLPFCAFGMTDSLIQDTVVFYGDSRMTVLLKEDTVMMSNRQFKAVRELVGSLNAEREICKDQVEEMKVVVSRGEEIVSRYKEMVERSEEQLKYVRKEYNTMVELYGQQRQLTMDLNNDRLRGSRRAMLRGATWGVVAGFIGGAILVAIIN